jgi:hypothetical protein
LLGSGNYVSFGGTLLWELHLHGAILVLMSRVMPIVISMALARWAVRRIGVEVLQAVPLLSLVGTSLGLRLVFEQNLFGYYFMALALTMVLLEIVQGKMRGQVLAWLALVSLAFSPVPWGFFSNSVAWGLQLREFAPFVFMAVAAAWIVHDLVRGHIRWYRVAFLLVVLGAFARLPWENPPFRHALPIWFWQVVLVSSGMVLIFGPLISAARQHAAAQKETSEVDQSEPLRIGV